MKLLKFLSSIRKTMYLNPGLSDFRAHTLGCSALRGTGQASQMVWGSICDVEKKTV